MVSQRANIGEGWSGHPLPIRIKDEKGWNRNLSNGAYYRTLTVRESRRVERTPTSTVEGLGVVNGPGHAQTVRDKSVGTGQHSTFGVDRCGGGGWSRPRGEKRGHEGRTEHRPRQSSRERKGRPVGG